MCLYTHIHIYMYIHTYICICTHLYIHICIYMQIYVCVFVHTLYIGTYVFIPIHIYIHTYTFVYMYVYTYMYVSCVCFVKVCVYRVCTHRANMQVSLFKQCNARLSWFQCFFETYFFAGLCCQSAVLVRESVELSCCIWHTWTTVANVSVTGCKVAVVCKNMTFVFEICIARLWIRWAFIFGGRGHYMCLSWGGEHLNYKFNVVVTGCNVTVVETWGAGLETQKNKKNLVPRF